MEALLAQIAELQAQVELLKTDKGEKWCSLIERFNSDKLNEAIKELGGEMKRPIMSRPIDYIKFARQYVIDMGYTKAKKKGRPASPKKEKVIKEKTGRKSPPIARVKNYEQIYFKIGEKFQQKIPIKKKIKGVITKKESIMVVEYDGNGFKDDEGNTYSSLYKATEKNIEMATGMNMNELNVKHKESNPKAKNGPNINSYAEYKTCGWSSVDNLTEMIGYRDTYGNTTDMTGRKWDNDNWTKYLNAGGDWYKFRADKDDELDGDSDFECDVINENGVQYYVNPKDLKVYNTNEKEVGTWDENTKSIVFD